MDDRRLQTLGDRARSARSEPAVAIRANHIGAAGLALTFLAQAADEGKQRIDLARLESEARHGWMPGHDTFGKRLCQVVDRVALCSSRGTAERGSWDFRRCAR
jgi:hypothetical protein